jgi:hypothetical protein
MNEDTLVVVHAYAGDRDRVAQFLPRWLHHDAQVLLLTPEDAPIDDIHHPRVVCRSAGLAGWKGAHTIHRQIAHWQIIQEFPQRWLLLNDSDSMCLSPRIPRYLYADPAKFWCNELGTYYLNYEPPYFFSRQTLDRLVGIALGGPQLDAAIGTTLRGRDRATLERLVVEVERFAEDRWDMPKGEFPLSDLAAIVDNPQTLRAELDESVVGQTRAMPDWGDCQAIDGFYVAITTYAGMDHRSYPNGMHGASPAAVRDAGVSLVHGPKTLEALNILCNGYAEWALETNVRAEQDALAEIERLRGQEAAQRSVREHDSGPMREGDTVTEAL